MHNHKVERITSEETVMKIMIVDDETISRRLLIKKMEQIGACTEVSDGMTAMELFEKALEDKLPFDLITLDVSMPKMDGPHLLKMIRKKEKVLKISKEKRVRIIMVTSRMNVSIIKECIKLGCDGYISKPVNNYQLLGNLGRIGFAQPEEIVQEEEKTPTGIVAKIINRFYQGKIKMPVLPGIVTQVRRVQESQDSTIEDLAKIIEKDIMISTKIIFIANSPLYRGIDKVEDLNSALLRLGMKAASGVISTLVSKDLFNSEKKIVNDLLQKLWIHSFACGCFGKRIAQETGLQNPDTVFLMGIVHDIGKMLLIRAIADIYPEESFESLELMRGIHEIHTTFGGVLLKKMHFPAEFIRIAEFHHWNDFSSDDDKELLVIHLADYLANRTGFRYFDLEPGEDKTDPDFLSSLETMESLKQLKLSAAGILEIADEIKTVIKESAPAF